MAFDILGYREKYKDYYGDDSLEDVARDAYDLGYRDQYPDFDTWKKKSGIESALIDDKLRRETANIAPGESGVFRRAVADPLVSLAKGAVVGIPETIVGLADIPTMGYAGKGVDALLKSTTGGGFKEGREFFDTLLSPETREAQEKVEKAQGFVETVSTAVQNPSSIVATIMESAPSMFGGAGLGRAALKGIGKAVLGKEALETALKGLSKEAGEELIKKNMQRAITAGAVGEGLVTIGQNTEQVRQDIESGLLNPAQVALMVGSGAATGIISRMSGGLAKRLGITDVDTLLQGVDTGAKRKGVIGVLKGLVESAITEGALEELPQSAQEQMAQNIATGKDPFNGVAEAGAMGLLAGAGMGLMGAGVGTIRRDDAPPPTYENTIKKIQGKAYFSDVIDNGLKTGFHDGNHFTPDHAIELIKMVQEKGFFTTEDIDKFKDKYPQLKDGLNGLVAENITKKVDEAVQNLSDVKLLPGGQGFELKGEPYQEGVTVGEPYGDVLRPVKGKTEDNVIDAEFSTVRRIEAPKREETKLLPGQGFELSETKQDEITTLQERIQKVQTFLDKNEKHKGGVKYQQVLDRLDADKARLAELTKGGDQNGTLRQTETTVTKQAEKAPEPEGRSSKTLTEENGVKGYRWKAAGKTGFIPIEENHGVKGIGTSPLELSHAAQTRAAWAIEDALKETPAPKGQDVLDARKEAENGQVRQTETEIEAKPGETPAATPWFRGVDQVNKTTGDKFYSASNEVAGDFGEVSEMSTEEMPKNPLVVGSKEELVDAIGYKHDPMAEPKDIPKEERFDVLAKKYAQDKGHDGIIYEEGTLGERELHAFGNELPAPLSQTDAATVGVTKDEAKSGESLNNQALIEEARKYKTVDEFVQKTHGRFVANADKLTPAEKELADAFYKSDKEAIWNKAQETKAPETGQAKEPYEMTKEEYVQTHGKLLPGMSHYKGTEKEAELKHIGARIGTLDGKPWNTNEHGLLVQQALTEGKPVPEEVLKDYPELQNAPAKVNMVARRQEQKAETTLKNKREAAIEKYRNHVLEKNPKSGNEFADKIVKLIDDRDGVELRKWMNGINPRINKLFYDLTGLPARTQKEVDASLRSLDPEKWDTYVKEHKEFVENKIAERKEFWKNEKINAEIDKKVKHEGQVLTKRELYDKLIGDGFTRILEGKRGVVPIYELNNPNSGMSIKIDKKIEAEYLRKRIEEKAKESKKEKTFFQETGVSMKGGKLVLDHGEVAKKPDLSAKSTGDLVKDMFSIINDHIGERGSDSTKEVDETLYEKLKPYLAEIVKRAKAKMMDARAYLFGAVDAMPDGKAKDIYEAAARRYADELDNEHYEKAAEKNINITPKERKVLDSFYEGKKTAAEWGEEQHLALTAGPAGAGKSTTISKEQTEKHVQVNSDLIRSRMNNLTSEYHERASALAEFLLNEAMDKGYHVVYDSQMTNYAKAKAAIEKVLANGGDILIGMTDIEADTSIVRSAVREQAIKEGLEDGEPRDVPYDVSIKGYNYALPTFLQLFKDYRGDGRFSFIMTNNNADIKPGEKVNPKLIFRQINGALEVFDFDTQKEIENIDKATETLDKILNLDYIKDEGGRKYVRNNKTDLQSQNWPEIHQRIDGILNDKRNARQKGRLGPESGRGGRDNQQPANPAAGEVGHDDQANGSAGEGTLEGDESGNLPANGRGQRPGRGKRSGSQADNEGNADLNDGGDVAEGSLAGEPTPVHLQDRGADSESVPSGTSAVEQPESEPRSLQLSGLNPGNYRITEQDNIGEGTRGQKIENNLAAIRLLKQLVKEHRYPTKAEQSVLAKYVGWGGIKNVFDDTSTKPQDIKAREELKSLLTKEEYFEARQSILNAHYTSPQVIKSIYKIMEHFGFTGGNILEPTYGVGNFIGLIPDNLEASSKWYGSELDPITAKIGQFLYPDSQLLHSGFQVAEFPYGKFDAAVGNPPFGDVRITDTRKDRSEINRMKIHNYVIAKEALHLRPGGILANVITSRFLDTADSEARDFLVKNFKFLGAIRLPNDAFAKNAGTEVTTDLVFFQRLMPDEKPDNKADWLTTGATMTSENGETITLNKYFAERPELMLGIPSMKGTMYGGAWKEGGKGEFTLNKREGQDIEKAIDGVLEKQFADLKDVARDRSNDKLDAAALSLIPNKQDVAVGGYFVDKDRIYMREDNDEYGNPQFIRLSPKTKWTEKTLLGETRYLKIKGMLEIRAKAYELVNAERFDLSNIEQLRKQLNFLYDNFVNNYGYLSESSNYSLMSDDIKIEFGLEDGFQKEITPARAKALGIKPSKAKAEKATLLKERMFYPEKEILYARNAADGYNISLSQKGKLDLDYIAKLTGLPKESVVMDLSNEGLIYRDPESQAWIQEDEYLSGNVKGKYKKVENVAGYEKNAAALKKVFPEDVTTENIYAGPGSTWIPTNHFNQFGAFIGITNPRTSIYPNGQIAMRSDGERQTDINIHWQNKYYSLAAIFNAAANNKTLIAWDGTGDDRVQNKEQTKVLANTVAGVRSTFLDWIFADDARAKELTKIYNDTQNTNAKRKNNGALLKTVGASPAVILRNTQRDAAWRIIQSPRVLLDHCVGAGKTYTIITGVQERVRMGLTRKAMIVVPNHLVGQWAADYVRLYPGARILAATKKDFSKPNRRRLFARIATGKYDAIIVGHSSFGFIPMEAESLTNLIMEEIAYLEEAHRQAEADGNKRLIKSLANRIAKKREKIAELLGKPKDNVTTFEGMGVDHLVVDESHEFKNLEYSSSMQNITGMGNPMGSKRAFDLYAKIRWLTTQEGYALNFATGTPISNSLVEMYALLRYMNREALKERGLEAFDSWANNYASIENRIEYTASQKLKSRSVMATFHNLNELLQMYEDFADIVMMSDLKRIYAEQIRERNARTGGNESEEFPIPKVKDGGRVLDVAPPTKEQIEYVDYLVARAERLEELGRSNDPKTDNHLWIMSDARKMALDIRLVDPKAKESPDNKINRAAKNIKDIYDQSEKDKGAQLVFCDLSTPSGTAQKNAALFIREALKKAHLEDDKRTKAILDTLSSYQEKWGYIRNRIEAEIETISDHALAETEQYMKRREELEEYLEKVTDDVSADLTTADTGFSVYDDLKAKLIMAGIPEGEVKFIHDANTEQQKEDMFALVNAGKVRVLIGSSQKMGAGMNVQERLVALHHMDAPWRPSDVEQREGRLVRQGNKLYFADPTGFDVTIKAYSTENTFDAVMWQILARKGGMLDDFRSGKRTIQEAVSDEANYSAFMAASTGNPAFKEKFELESAIEVMDAIRTRTITRLRAARQSLDYNKERREQLQNEIEKRDKIVDDLKDQSTFTYEGKTYKDNALEMVNKEADAIAESNRKNAKEYNDSIETAINKAFEDEYKNTGLNGVWIRPLAPLGVQDSNSKEFKDYKEALARYSLFMDMDETKKKIADAIKGIKKPQEKHFHSSKLAKSDKSGVVATALKMVEDINALDPSETLSFKLGNTEIIIKKEEGRKDKKENEVIQYYDFVVTADGLFVSRLENVREFYERNIWNLITVENVRNSISQLRDENKYSISSMDRSDETSQHTLKNLSFKDEELLKQKKDRYQEVLAEVQRAEAEIAERRAASGNKYLDRDRARFPDGVWNPRGNPGATHNVTPEIDPNIDKYFYFSHGEGAFKEVSGKSIDIMPGFDFFIFKENKKWRVIERKTGLSIAEGNTQKEAIDSSKKKAESTGREKLNAVIEKNIKDGKTSPWYKASQPAQGRESKEVFDEDIETIKAKWDEIKKAFEEDNLDPNEVAQQMFGKGYARLTKSESIQVQDEIALKYAELARYEAILSQNGDGNIAAAQNSMDLAFDRWSEFHENEEYPDEIKLAQLVLNSIKSGQQRLFTGQLYSGLDVTQTLNVLRGLKDNIQAAIPHIEKIGRRIWAAGNQTREKWFAKMKEFLGDLWDKFKHLARMAWNKIREERGSISFEKKGEAEPVEKTVNNVSQPENSKPIHKDPPVSRDPKVLNTYLKDETDAIFQTIMNKLHPKSMSWLETMLKSPEWFDHPQIQKIVKLFMRDRNEIYHETFNDLNMSDDIDSPESTVTEAAKALKNKGLTLAERMAGKTSPEYQRLMEIIDEGDTSWKRSKNIPLDRQIKQFEDHIRKQPGTTDDVIRVWKLYRQSYDKALDLQTAQLRKMIEELVEEANLRGETPDITELTQSLKGALATMEEWRGFYAPRVRESGNWAVQAYKEHGPLSGNKEWYREHKGSELAAQRRANELRREGWTIYKVGEVDKLPESVYQDVNAVATAKLIDSALEKLSKKSELGDNLTAQFNEEILREVSNAIKARGFRSTMIHRTRGNVVRGFIEDPIQRHLQYINSLSGGLSKARVARAAYKEMLGEKVMGQQRGGIDPVKDARAFAVAQNYIQEQLRNADASDRIIGLAKSIATFKFLGFNLRSLAVNMTAIMTTAPAAIHQYATGGKGSMSGVFQSLISAGKDYGALMAGRKLNNAGEQAFMDEVHKKGWDDAQYTREALGELSKAHSRIWSTLMDGSMYLFGKSEQWNRGTTMLAAYRLARKNGMGHVEASEAAKTSADKAHGVYGKSTMPMWAQGANPAAKLGQMMYVYSKFGHNYLQMLYDLGFKQHNVKGAMFAFLSPLVLAGGAALPFKDVIFGVFGFILGLLGFDRDPEKWVWDEIRKHLGGGAEKIGRHGLTGAMGVDISGSLSIGVGVPKDFIELTGAIGGVATELKEAGASMANKQPLRAAEHLLPSGLANPVRAYRESQEGVTTRNNRRVWNEKGNPYVPDTSATVGRAFGFRSTDQAVLSERTWEGHREQTAFSEKRNAIYERYRAWLLGGRNREDYKKIVKSVQEFNANIRRSGIRGESYITSESLRNQVRRMMRPSRKERSILEE